MDPVPKAVIGPLLLVALCGVAAAKQTPAPAPTPAPTPAPPAERQRKFVGEGPGGKSLEIAAGPGSIIGKDELILKEYVDIKYGDTRLQADFVRYVPATKDATALGNVILDQGTSRLTADKVTYNLETETGVFYKARGYAEPSYYFEADTVEKISKDEMVLHDATFTSCTQPVPYWSFKIESALIQQDNYAYLHHPRFKIGHVIVFYSPYLVWPVKADRASGLLFPEFGFSQRSGTIISNALYWAIRRNMDATFYLDYMSEAGYGTGLEYRYVPSENGRGYFTGYFIRDQVAEREQEEGIPTDRWVINYGHNQIFGAGWKMIATANFISDFDYYRDFERDIRLSTNPQALSTVFVTRNWGFYSLNLRGERREQLVNVDVPPALNDPFLSIEETRTSWIQPEIEIRGRRQRLGNTPFFLTLQSSLDFFDKGTEGAQYGRYDLFPVFSWQLSPMPWLDVDAGAGFQNTFYTKSQRTDLGCDNIPDTQDPGEGNGFTDKELDENQDGFFDAADDIGCDHQAGTGDFGEGNGILDKEQTLIVDEDFDRRSFLGVLRLIGPKFSRVFDRPDSTFSKQYKNTIEPQISYNYQSRVEDIDQIIPFDEIDAVAGRANSVTYSLVTRLFAKRPVGGTEQMSTLFGPQGSSFVGSGGVDPYARARQALQQSSKEEQQAAAGSPEKQAEAEQAKKRLSTVEIATLQISQDYSFLGPRSTSQALGSSQLEPLESNFGPVVTTLRVNPSIRTSVDLRGTYDILFRQIRDASLSANLRSLRHGFVDLTWSMVRDLEGRALFEQGFGSEQPFNRSQIGVQGETGFWGRKLLVGAQINYEMGDVLEDEPRLRDQRYRLGYNTQCCGFQVELLNRNFVESSQREFRFLINLKGVGNVIDFQSGSSGALPGTYPGIVP